MCDIESTFSLSNFSLKTRSFSLKFWIFYECGWTGVWGGIQDTEVKTHDES